MGATTGPILAMGAITLANSALFHRKPVDWRIPIATGITAGMFALGEKASPTIAAGLAWLALVAVLLVRVQPGVPSPVETALAFWESGGARTT